MKRRSRSNPWIPATRRPRKRGRSAVYPLPNSRQSRDRRRSNATSSSSPGFDETTALPIPIVVWGKRGQPRRIRLTAWLILATVPLTVLGWAGSILVPTAIEANQAMDKIFVTPVQRKHYVTPVASPAVAAAESPTREPTATAAGAGIGATPGKGKPSPTVAPPTPTPFPAWTGTTPINILLLGVDLRVNEESPPRSDTIIVVRVDPVDKRVDMLSIPRDLLVEIPGHYATKVNAAYPNGELDPSIEGGGPTLVAQTIEYNFGIYIDYFAEVDIAGMENVIDTLDGVIIDVQATIKDEQYPTEDYGYTRIFFSPGLQRMDGQSAVRYSRTRHDDNDFGRQARQQQVLLAMRERALETGVIPRLPQLISHVGDSVRTDLSPKQMLSLARLGQDIDRENIYTHSLLPYVHDEWIDGGYYLVANWDAIRAMVADLPSDRYARNGLTPAGEQSVSTEP